MKNKAKAPWPFPVSAGPKADVEVTLASIHMRQQYESLDAYGRRVADAFMASLVKLHKGDKSE